MAVVAAVVCALFLHIPNVVADKVAQASAAKAH